MNKTVVRTISGAGFAIVTLACLLFSQYLFAAYALFVMSVMLEEFFKMGLGDKFKCLRILSIITASTAFIIIFCNQAFGLPSKWMSLTFVPFGVMLAASLGMKDKSEFDKFSLIITGLIYIGLPLVLSNLVAFRHGMFDGWLFIYFFVIVWASDIGQYIFGMGFGQKPGSKKLCPNISPKKSWVGAWGGVAVAALSGAILSLTGALEYPIFKCICLALIMSITGILGDLFESMWKRKFGFKDSGNIIPGHGGMLDRFDSSLFAMTAGSVYLSLTGLI